MKRIICVALLSMALLLPSCATIFTRASYPFTINTDPNGAMVTISNSGGQIVYQGTTPANTRLKSSRGYMKDEQYTLTFSKKGFEDKMVTIHSRLDGWYIGNILLGGLIGMLVVDPLSGAMYRFKRDDRKMTQTLTPKTEEVTLNIYNIHDLPEGVTIDHLECIR